MGLVFNDVQGAKPVMRHLYENGVWAIFSTLDPSVLQFKPGLLLSQTDAEELSSYKQHQFRELNFSTLKPSQILAQNQNLL